MFVYLGRIIKTSFQHIGRNKWLSIASVAVIMLAFFLSSIFGALLFASNIVLDYLETQSHIYAFFVTGTEEEYISNVKADIEKYLDPESIEYTSEEQALEEFKEAYADNPTVVESITEDILPASLGIRAKELEDIPQILSYLTDLQEKDSKIETIKYREDVTQKIQQISKILRIAGISIVSFLVVISFLIVLITVGITISNYQYEIEIMQLVGAGRGYVRSPFILAGAIYGALGAIVSTITLAVLIFVSKYYLEKAGLLVQIKEFFVGVPIPDLSILLLIKLIAAKIGIGVIIGAVSSSFSVRKYIK